MHIALLLPMYVTTSGDIFFTPFGKYIAHLTMTFAHCGDRFFVTINQYLQFH
jgi:hypothetical protein